MSPKLRDYWLFLRDLINGKRLGAELNAARFREENLGMYLDMDTPLRVLDLANGRLQPQYQILLSQGHSVIGVDIANQNVGGWEEFAYRFARSQYSRQLPRSGSPPNGSGLICGDVAKLPVKNDYFDLVTSFAAFEHFLEVPAVIKELQRVIRPGGLIYCGIHIFTSLSGGHNVQLMGLPIVKLAENVDPWDHLRERRIPFHVPLNEWRIEQYVDAFGQHFEILKNACIGREGEHLLTPEIQAELSEYSRDELTCSFYLIIARKPID